MDTNKRATALSKALDIHVETLLKIVEKELGHRESLDRFVSYGDIHTRANPISPILHIVSGNTPAAAIQTITRGLLVGAFNQIDIKGLDGQTLKDKWEEGPQTYLGLQIEGFPNLLTLVGPHNAATFCNIPRCIEQNVEWVTDLMRHMLENGYEYIAATRDAEIDWTAHVHHTAEKMLFSKVDSWFMGFNPNLPGRQKRTFMLYAGGAPGYRDKCDESVANDYEGFELK